MSRIFFAKMTCVYTSSPMYFSVFPKSSVAILNSPSSLSNSALVFVAFVMFGNLVLNAFSKLTHFVFVDPVAVYHSSAGESLFRKTSRLLIFWSSAWMPACRKERFAILRDLGGWGG